MVRTISTAIVVTALLSAAFAKEPVAADRAPARLFGNANPVSVRDLYTFRSGVDGSGPYSGLIGDGSGALYGTTYKGDTGGESGTVYKLIPSQNGYQFVIIYTFGHSPGGWEPHGSLLADRNGALYGTTYYGGTANIGTVYKLTPSGNGFTETVIHSFQGGADGDYPNASLIADASGALYGTTEGGGGASGTVFKLTPYGTSKGTSYSERILYSFQGGVDGSGPFGSLIADSSGALLGTTIGGGAFGKGTVFRLTPTGNGYSETILHSFRGIPDGEGPAASLLPDASGALYGTTTRGGTSNAGAIFKLTPHGTTYRERVVHSFDGIAEYYSQSPLIADGAGALYGTTVGASPDGQRVNLGTVFKLVPGPRGYSEHILRTFSGGAEGMHPFGGLLIDSDGSLVGTTNGQLFSNDGSIFKLVPHGGGYSEHLIHSFHWYDFGANPFGGLTLGSGNVFYGTTTSGGTVSQGTVFAAIPSASGYGERVLYRFQGGEDGSSPLSAPIVDSSGALYGTTGGNVYKLTPKGSGYAISVLHDFSRNDGFYPSGLIADNAGALYGANYYGGPHQSGTAFKMTPTNGGYSYTIIHAFKHSGDGDHPDSSLIMDSSGALYGTTYQGGTGSSGTVYELTPVGGAYQETLLHSFDGNVDGANPTAALFTNSSGSLFGTTSSGNGNSLCGSIFELTPEHGRYAETFLHVLTGNPDGCQPNSALVEAPGGVLYGTTEYGGLGGQGTVYELSPSGGSFTYSVLFSFSNALANGSDPSGPIIVDARGAIYGATFGGGPLGQGTIFKVVP